MKSLFHWKPKNRMVGIAFIFLILSGLYTWPIFEHPSYWGPRDWNHDLFMAAFPRDCIVKYFQFPLWCPYLGGGVPYLAYEHSEIFSPLFLVILLFGEVLGIKLSIFLHTFIGLVGMYLLARWFKLNRPISIFSAFVYNLSGFFAVVLAEGMSEFLPSSYLPLIFLFFLKGAGNWRWLIASSFFLALVIGEGGTYIFFIITVFLTVYSLFNLRRNDYSILKRLGIVGIFTFLFGAIKIIPFYAFIKEHPRLFYDNSGFTFKSLAYSLAYPGQRMISPAWKHVCAEGSYGPDEHAMYVGVITLLLAVIGMVYFIRRDWRFVAVFLIFSWMMMGYKLPVSLWGLVRRLPVFSSMRVAQRFRFIFLLFISLYSGFGISVVWKAIKDNYLSSCSNAGRVRWGRILSIVLISVLILNMLHVTFSNSLIFKDAFVIPPKDLRASPDFMQISDLPSPEPFAGDSAIYLAYLQNIGTVLLLTLFHDFPRNAGFVGDPGYRGERFFEKSIGIITGHVWSPNKFKVKVRVGEKDRLVINQNYYKGWRVKAASGKRYAVENYKGLISTVVDKGEDYITFYYLPLSFVIGFTITGISLILAACYLLFTAKAKKATLLPWNFKKTAERSHAPGSAVDAPESSGAGGERFPWTRPL